MLRSITNLTSLTAESLPDSTTPAETVAGQLPETMTEKAMFALENSLLGLLIVFSVLAVLFIVVKIVASILSRKKEEKKPAETKAPAHVAAPAPTPAPVPTAATNDGEIIAAITAAISLMLEAEGKDPRGFRVVSFRRSSQRKNSL